MMDGPRALAVDKRLRVPMARRDRDTTIASAVGDEQLGPERVARLFQAAQLRYQPPAATCLLGRWWKRLG